MLGGQVRQQALGHAQRGDGVGQEQLTHFLGAGLCSAVVLGAGDPGIDEDDVEALVA